MAKVTINGEVFGWDPGKRLMSHALALEEALGCNYAVWQEDLAKGSARAMCGQVWLILRANGRDVPIADILSGAFDFDLNEITYEDDAQDPTSPSPEASDTTGGDTSEPSPSS